MKDDVTQSLLGRATHYTSTGCRGGDLKAYLAYKMTCSGQPMNKLGAYPFQTSVVPIHQPRRDGSLGWPGNLIQEPGIGRPRQPAPRPTAFHELNKNGEEKVSNSPRLSYHSDTSVFCNLSYLFQSHST